MNSQNLQANQQINLQQQNISKLNTATLNNQQQSITPIEDKQKQKLIILDERFGQIILKFLLEGEDESKFDQYMLNLEGDIIQQHCGMIKIRKLFGDSKPAQLPQPKLSLLLQKIKIYCFQSMYPQLRLQASWTLANILAGTSQRCAMVINQQIVQLLMRLLEDESAQIVVNAVSAFGNIAADSCENRNMLLNLNIAQKIISKVQTYQSQNINHGQLFYWSISNFCRNVPANFYQSTIQAVPVYAHAFKEGLIKDPDILCGCYWSLKYIAQKRKGINKIIKEGMLPYLIQIVKKQQKVQIICPCLQIIGEISKGNEAQTDMIATPQLLQIYFSKLYHPKKIIRQDLIWIISNITAGTRRQIDLILKQQLLLNRIFELFQFDTSSIIKQIGYLFANLTHDGDQQTIFSFYVRNEMVKKFVKALRIVEGKHISHMMNSLLNIFRLGLKRLINQRNVFVDEAISCGIEEICHKMAYLNGQEIQQSLGNAFYYLNDTQMI